MGSISSQTLRCRQGFEYELSQAGIDLNPPFEALRNWLLMHEHLLETIGDEMCRVRLLRSLLQRHDSRI
jgi:hypothetical protein